MQLCTAQNDFHSYHIDGLVQERRNSSALGMELRLFCANLSICCSQLLDTETFDTTAIAILW